VGWSWLPQAQAQPAGRGGDLAAERGGAQPERGGTPAASTGGIGGNPNAEFRARLLTELQLTPSQVEKVDAIYAGVRPRFMQLRDLPAEERTKARESISAEVRARIGDLLTAEQKPKYAAMLAEAANRTSSRGKIYLLMEDGNPRAFNVRLGITDGTSTELIVSPNSPDAAELKEGAAVVTGVTSRAAPATAARSAGPRMPF
jgi:HlyD family secretion protein